MLPALKKPHQLSEAVFMGILSAICMLLSLFRMSYTQSPFYLFLNWNLFLAFIPWLLSHVTLHSPRLLKNTPAIGLVFILWLLFFPNAPYILTDLFHLGNDPTMPLWFDLVLILFFAWTGLLFGFLSLWNLETLLKNRLHPPLVSLISIWLLFLSSFGIYLGRYLRWNSWDIVGEPFGLMHDIGSQIMNPLHHPSTWGMTLTWGILLNAMYFSFRLIKNKN